MDDTPDNSIDGPGIREPRRGGRRVATVETVAAKAGVSRQTVSNVVRSPERVKPETRDRVERVIKELDYRPNRTAQSLQSRSAGALAYRCHRVDGYRCQRVDGYRCHRANGYEEEEPAAVTTPDAMRLGRIQ